MASTAPRFGPISGSLSQHGLLEQEWFLHDVEPTVDPSYKHGCIANRLCRGLVKEIGELDCDEEYCVPWGPDDLDDAVSRDIVHTSIGI